MTTYFFAGGGTGGHLYPGLAIAECLRELSSGPVTCHFLASDRAIDRQILTTEGAMFTPLAAKPFSLRPRGLVRFVRNWAPSLREARGMIREAQKRGPVQMVAMGGFVAAPAVQAARVEGVPITLVNLDAHPGKANRWIAKYARDIFTSVPLTGLPRWKPVPPIVRKVAKLSLSREQCRRELGLRLDQPVLMITGGSQGAGSINRLMMALAKEAPQALAGWQVLHQAGGPKEGASDDVPSLMAAYKQAGISAAVVDFTRQMGLWWGSSDLAISRAGAGAVAEAWANKVPTVFMPYPYHKDQHQKANAQSLVEAGSCVCVEDAVEPAANMRGAGSLVIRLLTTPDALEKLKRLGESLPPADGAEQVARKLVLNV
jgi:UDP-N-acetylglucosamine--N-acetylmuramyl-(pentapeptide) pyrophosphoryl-undecaprenol N-acetylglucosamine transferase